MNGEDPRNKQAPMCSFEQLDFPEDLVVLAAVGYSGQKTGFQIDHSGHQATRVDITVNVPDRPVALLLGNYEPTIWNLSWTEGTQILAFVLSGYYRQELAGAYEKTPMINSTYSNQGACGYFYMSPDKRDHLDTIAAQLFKRPVDTVYLAEEGIAMVGDPPEPGTRLMKNAANTPESYFDHSAPLAGQAGLEEALRQGVLRVATLEDAQRWDRAFQKHQGGGNPSPVDNQSKPTELYNSYVVLKEFTFPSGLYGKNAATFFIPKGVPSPQGNPGHSSVCDFNSLSRD